MIFSNVFQKNFQSVRAFLHARFICACARAHSCVVYLLIHALNRFTKSYKIISDCSDWGIDTLF